MESKSIYKVTIITKHQIIDYFKTRKMKLLIILLLANIVLSARLKSRISNVISNRNLEPYIFGGTKATDGDAPWQVSIQDSQGNNRCGGTILGEQWVVTSQSCINGSQARYKINRFFNYFFILKLIFHISELKVEYNTITLGKGQKVDVLQVYERE